MRVTIAGASGFVGKNLLDKISDHYLIRALSRSQRQNNHLGPKNIEWYQADLFSYNSIKKALADTEIAIYLVHSMLPSAKLFQGDFQDTDLFLADNFAKACVHNKVKKIIYLGGLVPENGTSKHLESRREVEEVLKNSGIPVTILRAGMVVGSGGSSFEILKNLVHNLPFMLLPKWTKSSTQVIHINDLTQVISQSIQNNKFSDKTLDVVNGERITYEYLIKETANFVRPKTLMVPVPINYTSFSKLWVKLFGETDYELVSPLIDSLLCDLPSPAVCDLISPYVEYRSYTSMLSTISKNKIAKQKKYKRPTENTVRSIQRLSNPNAMSVKMICDEYIDWLPKYFRYIVKAERNDNQIFFRIAGFKIALLILKHIENDELIDRVKFHIVGGLLSKTNNTGWLEFRNIMDGKYTLASINNFIPSLPWFLYKYTQAIMHTKVMYAFSQHLKT